MQRYKTWYYDEWTKQTTKTIWKTMGSSYEDIFLDAVTRTELKKSQSQPKPKPLWFEASKKYKKLHVYDFDDTLVQTPKKPERGTPRHGWNGKDWWGSPESLQPPFMSGVPYHKTVLHAMNTSQLDSDVFTILLTGRRGVVAWAVRSVLQRIKLYGSRIIPDSNKIAKKRFQQLVENGKDRHYPIPMHQEFYSGDFITEEDYPKNKKGKPQHGTIYHKRYVVTKLLHDQMEELVIWDDRSDHIRPFIAMSLDFLQNKPNLKSAQINRVFPIYTPVWNEENCAVIEIPVKPGMSY